VIRWTDQHVHPRWTDQHCHLDPESADEVVAECRESGVLRLIDVGTDVASSQTAIAMAERFDDVWATAGVHPHDASGGIEGLEALLSHPRVVGVGECGLDYHYDHSPRDAQRVAFADQIALAHAHDLALVIHTRSAWDDTFDILGSEGVPERTVMHCFTGGPDEARICLELGAHLSFSGIVTFPSAPELREAARLCPSDRLLVETDSPYLAPVPHRGRRNRPALVAVVGTAVAEARGETAEDVAAATWRNAEHLYGLPGS
jgi:TatD DNase family protein